MRRVSRDGIPLHRNKQSQRSRGDAGLVSIGVLVTWQYQRRKSSVRRSTSQSRQARDILYISEPKTVFFFRLTIHQSQGMGNQARAGIRTELLALTHPCTYLPQPQQPDGTEPPLRRPTGYGSVHQVSYRLSHYDHNTGSIQRTSFAHSMQQKNAIVCTYSCIA